MKTAFQILVILLASLRPVLADGDAIERIFDVPYGELGWQKLDVYRPSMHATDAPIVIFFFGGGWRYGDKSALRSLGEGFARDGIVFVAPNYRLGSDAVFPNFVQDCALAVAHVIRTEARAQGRESGIFVGGWSAGAYNAAMVSLNQTYLEDEGVSAKAIHGFFGLSGPYQGGLCAGARCPSVFPAALEGQWHIADFVEETDVPMLLIHGERDRYVAPEQHQEIAAAALASGLSVTVLELQEVGHSILPELGRDGSEVRQAVLNFVRMPLRTH